MCVGAKVAVWTGSSVGVRVGSGVGVLVGSGVAGSRVHVGDGVGVTVGPDNGDTFTVWTGKPMWSAVAAGAGVADTGAVDAGALSILQRAMSKTPIAQAVTAASTMPAASTGHHREGTSRFPRQTVQNSSPAFRSFLHHLHGRGGNTPLHIWFAFSLAICAISLVP